MGISRTHNHGLLALSPLGVFIALYLALSIVADDFYCVPITVAFLLSSIYSIAIIRHTPLAERVNIFSRGAASTDLLLMIWIFIMAGAFAASAKSMGSIEATVHLSLTFLPSQLLLAGLFLASCFISLSVGTSVGTIVALVPIAAGVATQTGSSLPLVVGSVVGGAYFGDNLSFISDTTIMATRTQGCKLSDKFRFNVQIVTPAAILVLLIYIFLGQDIHAPQDIPPVNWLLVLPYVLVLALAILGVDVMLVLTLGLVLTGAIGMYQGCYTLYGWFSAMGEGILDMSELIIVTLLAAGMMGVIRHQGGVDYILHGLTRHVSSRRGAELAMALLVVLTDFCTANNTIAILSTGPLAREIAHRFGIDPRRSASILDTFSCFAQGIIPYGAQMLMASGLAMLNPIEIIPYLYYPFIMGLCALTAILWKKS